MLNSTFRDTEAHDWRQSRARTRGTSTYRQVLSRKRAAQAHAHAGQRAGPLWPLRTTSDAQHQILNLKSCWKIHSPHALNQRRRERSGPSLSPLYSADTQSTAFWAAPGGPLGPAHAQGSAPPRLAHAHAGCGRARPRIVYAAGSFVILLLRLAAASPQTLSSDRHQGHESSRRDGSSLAEINNRQSISDRRKQSNFFFFFLSFK